MKERTLCRSNQCENFYKVVTYEVNKAKARFLEITTFSYFFCLFKEVNAWVRQ